MSKSYRVVIEPITFVGNTICLFVAYVTEVSGTVRQRSAMLSAHLLEILIIRHSMVRDTTSTVTAATIWYRENGTRSKLRT